MQAQSPQVTSNQPHPHPKLAAVLARHLSTPFEAPLSEHGRDAYARLLAALEADPRPLVLDSFCGTGHSTAELARRHPDHVVVGIDKSVHRLGKHPRGAADNYLLLRANCEEIWRQLAAQGRRVDYHYLLYPNPWPKARHLVRRVHGHPAFPQLLALGGRVELRSNWQLYVEEFGIALSLAGHCGSIARVAEGAPPLTLFEQKYRQSGHSLWSCTCLVAP